MDQLNSPEARELAYKWAIKWVRNNYLTYRETRAMFEKYSAVEVGGQGGGGEYEVQLGFGWSNGAILDLLEKYGDKLTAIGKYNKWKKTSNHSICNVNNDSCNYL